MALVLLLMLVLLYVCVVINGVGIVMSYVICLCGH